MKQAVFAFSLAVALAVGTFAQTPSCPTVSVSSPDSSGSPVTYTVNVSGGDKSVTPTYNWTVSAGTISRGQGTSSISVDATGAPGMITATVDVGGYDRSCSTSQSSTTMIANTVEARMFDSTMKVNAQERFDNLAIELKASPQDQLYIIAYGGRRSYPGEADASLKRAKDYLVKKGVRSDRIVTVDGGYREEAWRELWIVPSGAAPPFASPNVDPSEVMMGKAPGASKKPVRKRKS